MTRWDGRRASRGIICGSRPGTAGPSSAGLREVNFRCTVSGAYRRFSLTPAQDETFVEIEGGVAPLGLQGRIMKAACPLFFKRWLVALVEALPKVVAGRKGVSPKQG